jgi:hypothetical protein
MQQPVLWSPKFGTKSSHIFTQSPQNITVVCGIDCLACQDEFFANNPLDVKKKWWARSWLRFSPVSPFPVSVSLDFPCTAHAFFPERLSIRCQGLCRSLPEICTEFDAVPFSDTSQNRIGPDTRLQTKGRKNQYFHAAAWNFVHWLPRYASIIIYRYIALLQLQYRGQYQSRKLWIPLVYHRQKHLELIQLKTVYIILNYISDAQWNVNYMV